MNINNVPDEDNEYPLVIKVCICQQCKYVKNKRKNRIQKNKIKRILNKKRRSNKHNGKCYTHHWA